MARTRLLVVDSEERTATQVLEVLGQQAVDVASAGTWESALGVLTTAREQGAPFDMLLVAQEILEVEDGMLQELAARGFDPYIVVLATDVSRASAADAGFDVVVKPPSRGELKARLERSLRSQEPEHDGGLRKPRKSDVIIGGGGWIKDLYDKLSMAAPTDVTMAVYGESGTGKELVARTIHALSNRYQCPFVVVNCAAIPESLLEDELFGHVKGAYTDAARDREGLFAAADTGTIFLDEIGEMPLALQAKLLRVLQSGEFRRIGANKTQQVNVRVIAATNKDLGLAVSEGRFREDLYYRINVFPLLLPALRERLEDIPLLAHHFMRKHRRDVGKDVVGFSPEALSAMSSYPFPGNVRELENRVHRALVMARAPMITVDDLDLGPTPERLVTTLDLDRPFRELKQEAVARFEREYLERLLTAHRGNLAAAARAAGVDRKNLWAMAKKRGVDVDRFRRGEDR